MNIEKRLMLEFSVIKDYNFNIEQVKLLKDHELIFMVELAEKMKNYETK